MSFQLCYLSALFVFFFQAEDGIRDFHVTGVQTCALPICLSRGRPCNSREAPPCRRLPPRLKQPTASTIGSVGMSFSTVTERIPLKAKASSTPLAIDALGS